MLVDHRFVGFLSHTLVVARVSGVGFAISRERELPAAIGAAKAPAMPGDGEARRKRAARVARRTSRLARHEVGACFKAGDGQGVTDGMRHGKVRGAFSIAQLMDLTE